MAEVMLVCCVFGMMLALVKISLTLDEIRDRMPVVESVEPPEKTAAEVAKAHAERRRDVPKPPARWPAVRRQLEHTDAPEQRVADVMEAHKDLA